MTKGKNEKDFLLRKEHRENTFGRGKTRHGPSLRAVSQIKSEKRQKEIGKEGPQGGKENPSEK